LNRAGVGQDCAPIHGIPIAPTAGQDKDMGMTYELAHLEAGSIDGVRSESYEAGPGRWTCISYLEHTPVQSFVTTQHPVRDVAIAHMAVLLAEYFNAEVVRWD
jgi:hypothetical protein